MRTRLGPAVALVLLALTAACGSSDKVSGPSNNTSCNNVKLAHGSISAKINGATWCANVGLTATYHGSILAIGATDNTGQTLGIGVAVLNGPGTYAIGPLSATNATLFSTGGGGWSATLAQGSGSVTITSISAAGASGTFAFSMMPSTAAAAGAKNITNGAFNVTF